MKLDDFNYDLPERLIADRPVQPRDNSRLLVLDRQNGQIDHMNFYDIVRYLHKGDLLVLNNSKVFPARLIGRKELTGGRVEILLENEVEPGLWTAIGKNLKIGSRVIFDNSKLEATVLKKEKEIYTLRFNLSKESLYNEIEKIGLMPVPPYIEQKRNRLSINEKSKFKSLDKKRYQTIYAQKSGSIAAPTAGLHFTKKLIEKIREAGVEVVEITLHVGLGTFLPVKEEQIEKHQMHHENYAIDKTVFQKIVEAKNNKKRVIVVGTTTTRVLEDVYSQFLDNPERVQLEGSTNIFIYPGYQFNCIDGLITNFHLPKSTLLMLVSAFAGRDQVMRAYEEAITRNYRFYSYGDAMLII